MPKPLYVFDLDDTLIGADSSSLWHEFLVNKGIATDPNFLAEDERLMTLYSKGELCMDEYLAFSMQPLKKLSTQEVDALVKECVKNCILPKQFIQAKALIAQLTQDKIEMVIVSATVTFIVKQVATALGVKHALGVDMVEIGGKYSADIKGVPSYREGKVTRLKQWLAEQGDHYSEIHFYTDSINDLPMCRYANFSYLVNPCPRLKEYANEPDFELLEWQTS